MQRHQKPNDRHKPVYTQFQCDESAALSTEDRDWIDGEPVTAPVLPRPTAISPVESAPWRLVMVERSQVGPQCRSRGRWWRLRPRPDPRQPARDRRQEPAGTPRHRSTSFRYTLLSEGEITPP